MFPNVRLLVGALFITVLVLSCEFGVFAALRVNREPLSRLTSESAPLQLVAGKNVPLAVPISWSAPRNAPAPAGDAQTGVATAEVRVPQPAARAIETPVPSNDGAAGTPNSDNQTNPAALQTALAPPPVAPAPAAGAAAPIAQAPIPLPANTLVPAIVAPPANPEANVASGQDVPAPASNAAGGNPPPEQTAAVPAVLAAAPAQQTPAAEIIKPAEAEPQAALRAHEAAAPAGEPPAGSAPVIAAIATAAPKPATAPPADITGSVPNAVMPARADPKAEAPHAKPLPKIVHKPAARKPHKAAHAPAQRSHATKKRIARRARPAAAASTAQPATDFNNPVFQSAPEYQRPTRSRAGAKNSAKNTATNNGFSNTFGGQFGRQ